MAAVDEIKPIDQKFAKKSPKKNTSVSKTKKSKKNQRRTELIFGFGLHKLMKQKHPDFEMSTAAVRVLNDFTLDALNQLLDQAESVVKKDKRQRVDERDMQTAARLAWPARLGKESYSIGKHARDRASIALAAFRAAKPPRRHSS